ncbi:hypothetical protein H8B04_13700 [Sphingobacterium sp. DN04309]|uniref:Uncharacterized protein n=1 Tax=Sphingobacterium litopenaei TaxID=2763500 RepID=A0ABR7YH02_9SPHI|nr:hypothetical protein [Sphingobacterium litopenaei]
MTNFYNFYHYTKVYLGQERTVIYKRNNGISSIVTFVVTELSKIDNNGVRLAFLEPKID